MCGVVKKVAGVTGGREDTADGNGRMTGTGEGTLQGDSNRVGSIGRRRVGWGGEGDESILTRVASF